MKTFLIILFVLFCQYKESNSSGLLQAISNKFKEVGNAIACAFKSLRTKIRDFLFPEFKNMKKLTKDKKEKEYENERLSYGVIGRAIEDNQLLRKMRSDYTVLVTAPQLIILHGKRVESHVVLTKDGYFITLHRLKNESDATDTNNTVLLHHGLLGSSADWILLGPKKSLPYLLLNAGYDVWLTNARGNYYSRGHVDTNNAHFWKFSWQEMGKYDLPAVVDYIMQIKNTKEKLTFIGHSMGTTVFLSMLALFPDYNKQFRIAILLAPLVFMDNAQGPLRALSSVASNPSTELKQMLGEGEFMPNRKIPSWIATKYCKDSHKYCMNPLLFLTGSAIDEKTYDVSLIKSIMYHVPAGGSTNTVLHYAQMIKSGKFQLFNNEMEELSLRTVNVPIVLFSSSDDVIANGADVLELYMNLVCPIDHHVIHKKNFTHVDFVWNARADELIFQKIIVYLQGNHNCNTSKTNEV